MYQLQFTSFPPVLLSPFRICRKKTAKSLVWLGVRVSLFLTTPPNNIAKEVLTGSNKVQAGSRDNPTSIYITSMQHEYFLNLIRGLTPDKTKFYEMA